MGRVVRVGVGGFVTLLAMTNVATAVTIKYKDSSGKASSGTTNAGARDDSDSLDKAVATTNSSTLGPLTSSTTSSFLGSRPSMSVAVSTNNSKRKLGRMSRKAMSVNGSSITTRSGLSRATTGRLMSRRMYIMAVTPVMGGSITRTNIGDLAGRRLVSVFAKGAAG